MSPTRPRAGFTLIEVLLATFVIALGVLGILALFAGAAKQQQASSFETAAIFATKNAEGLLTSNFSALGVDPGAPPPREDVWHILPMRGCDEQQRYLTAPPGQFFLVSVTQPTVLYQNWGRNLDGASIVRRPATMQEVPASTAESDRMSRALQQLGFRFVGTTICYALMQACGLVDDHIVGCHCARR